MTGIQRLRFAVVGVALMTLTLMAACAKASPGGTVVQAAAMPQGDAAELAGWVEAQCQAVATRAACREAALVRIAEARGIATAMDVVARLELTDSDGHAASHVIGIRGYRGMDSAAEDFASCTTLYQSGCYHGVVQAYFADLRQVHGPDHLDEKAISALCAPYRDREDGRWSQFQCIHGVGHGVMLVTDNQLPQALELCDLLPTTWERAACYGGAFMENAVMVVSPHHDHAGAAVAGREPAQAAQPAHAGHDAPDHHAHHSAAVDPFPAIDPEDLHHPCSALGDRYQVACYEMQTAIMLHLLDRDVAATAAACLEAPDDLLREVCHRSLGRDINAIAGGEHARSVELCNQASAPFRPSCHVGVVKNVIDVTAGVRSGVAYCEQVAADTEREACVRAIGEQATVLIPRPADRARFCRTLTGTDQAACLAGAGADPVGATASPDDLPPDGEAG